MSPLIPRLTLLSKPGCHLCDDARRVLQRVAADHGVVLTERDITTDPADYARWADWIPVTLIDGVEHAVFTVDEPRLRSELAALCGAANQRKPSETQ
jgi:glutaredoxin